MKTITNLLAAPSSLQDFTNSLTGLLSQFWGWIIGLLGTLVVFWCVYIGVKIAAANNRDQRQEAKKLVIQLVVGIVSIFLLAILVVTLISVFGNWYDGNK
jgi:amino acid transporter